MNPYYDFVSKIASAVVDARKLPLGALPPAPKPPLSQSAPKALFFSPHPDDECICGGLLLRLLREAGMDAQNVAVTQGSRPDRQGPRYQELAEACKYLGFGLIPTGAVGLEKVNVRTRQQEPAHWAASVDVIVGILKQHQPRVVIFPHDADWNSTHIGTHFLVADALAKMPASFECYTVESEFWGAMTDPNLMVEISAADLADMVAALTFHKGEVARNPYHLLLPAWMMDNVRRGGEVVGGQGGAAPDFRFATLYRLRKWTGGKFVSFYSGGKQIPAGVNIRTFFA